MIAPDTIIVMRSPGETRSALLAGDDVIEVVHRRDGEIVAGSARTGRVVGHAPGFAFIDVGDARPGVLKTKAPLVEGSALPVRIVVPPRGDKGAELARASSEAPAPEPAVAWWTHYRNSIERILASPAAELRRLTPLLPRATLADGGGDPFVAHGVDAAIEAALEPVVPLAGGGRLIIEPTAAAVCIDIDAGPVRPAQVNAAAVAAIAHALRLRNLAGHVLIDVIPGGRVAAKAFATQLRDAVNGDPVPTQVAGTTPLGMVELTRRREGLSLAETFADPATNAGYAVLRAAVQCAVSERASRLRIAASEIVAARLQGPLAAAVVEAARAALCEITLEAKASWPGVRAEVASRR